MRAGGGIHTHVAWARERLRAAGISDSEADLDARLLAQTLLHWDAARLLAAGNEAGPPDFEERYRALAARRQAREPLAYIIGRQDFWDLSFEVTPAVLIPRPETELIVEVALELFPNPAAQLTVADVGTGSGCLAIVMARERPRSRVVAIDISDAALEVARRNAVLHGVADRIVFVRNDLLLGMADGFDLIVSNPPYVPAADRDTLQPEVRDHEPAIALFAGPDGLATVRRLLSESVGCLARDGVLLFEFGFGQSEAVRRLISDAPGLTMVGLRMDLQRIPRMAIARRSGETLNSELKF